MFNLVTSYLYSFFSRQYDHLTNRVQGLTTTLIKCKDAKSTVVEATDSGQDPRWVGDFKLGLIIRLELRNVVRINIFWAITCCRSYAGSSFLISTTTASAFVCARSNCLKNSNFLLCFIPQFRAINNVLRHLQQRRNSFALELFYLDVVTKAILIRLSFSAVNFIARRLNSIKSLKCSLLGR